MKFNKQDFEKYTTGILYAIVVLSIVYKFLETNIISVDAIYFTTITGSFFIGRKIAKYAISKTDTKIPTEENQTTTTDVINRGYGDG